MVHNTKSSDSARRAQADKLIQHSKHPKLPPWRVALVLPVWDPKTATHLICISPDGGPYCPLTVLPLYDFKPKGGFGDGPN